MSRLSNWFHALGLAGALACAVTLLGLGLRIEHALTFDGPRRGSDYGSYTAGVRWTLEHKRPFHFDPSANTQIAYQPPLWYAAAAVLLAWTHSERSIAALAVFGWLVRQALLALFIRKSVPNAKWSALAVLSLHAFLPLSVLLDGKVNPEGVHATLFVAAAYSLWLIERRAAAEAAVPLRLAVTFGLLAGLALLTKATSSVLMLAAGVSFAWLGMRSAARLGWLATWRTLMRPALCALAVWTLVVSFWVGPNLAQRGHPFPHAWSNLPQGPEPVLYRRPLGWALPFEWRSYFESPVICSPFEPRANFWSAMVTGTWTDFYNRGFCRAKGGATIEKVWGGKQGTMPQGEGWGVSTRCIEIFRGLLAIGLPITLGCVFAVGQVLWWFVRSHGARGSLVLPACIALGTLFLILFALTYPVDGAAVTNPRYLLPLQALVLACAGMSLGRIEATRVGRIAIAVVLCAVAVIGALLVYERFA